MSAPARFLTPDCPLCGQPPAMILPGGTQAFCGNVDGCDLLTWNPSVSLDDNLTSAGFVQLPSAEGER